MPTTTSSTRPDATSRRPRTSRQAALLTCLLPAGTAIVLIAVMTVNATPPEGPGDLVDEAVFLVWNLLPMAGAALLLLWAGRLGWGPYAVAAVGNVALAGLTGWALSDFAASDSSTAALLFIFLPIYLGGVVVITAGLVVLARWWSRRRA